MPGGGALKWALAILCFIRRVICAFTLYLTNPICARLGQGGSPAASALRARQLPASATKPKWKMNALVRGAVESRPRLALPDSSPLARKPFHPQKKLDPLHCFEGLRPCVFQVKVWFQNRRTKHKRTEQEEEAKRSSSTQKRPSERPAGDARPGASDREDLGDGLGDGPASPSVTPPLSPESMDEHIDPDDDGQD